MLKILTFLAIIGFAWWRVHRFFWARRLRKQGIHIPEEKGMRPVTLLAGTLLGVYFGFFLWHLLGSPGS